MSDIWKQFGSDYDSVNQNLGGAADWLKGAASSYKTGQSQQPEPAQQPQPPQQSAPSYGAAGLAPALGPVMAAGGGVLAGGLTAAFAPPIAAAYGLGKLIAPDKVDTAIGKIRDFIAPKVQRAEQVGSAYETGMAEGVIPGSQFIERKILPQHINDYLQAVKQGAPGSAMAGQTAGVIGSMALPGLNVAKGAGFLPGLANAAANAAPYALGSGLDVGAATGDPTKGIVAGLVSEGLGALVPSLISGAMKLKPVQKVLTDMQLAGAHMNTGDFVKAAMQKGKAMGLSGGALKTFIMQNSAELKQNAVDLISKFGPFEGGKEAIKDWNAQGFEAHAQLWDQATGKSITPGDIGDVAKDPDLAPIRTRFGDQKVDQAVQDIGKEIDGIGWTKARSAGPKQGGPLNTYIQAGFKASPKSQEALDASVAHVWKDYLDGGADNLADMARQQGVNIPELSLLKSTYPAVNATTAAGAREESKISGRFGEGSDTASRIAMMAAGGALGAGEGQAESPGDWGRILTRAAMGSVAGRMLTRGAGRAMEAGAGALAGGLAGSSENLSTPLARLLGRSGELGNIGAQQQTEPSLSQGGQIPGIPQQGAMPQGPQTALSPESPLARLAAGGQVWPQMQQSQQSPFSENIMAAGRAINDKEQELTTQQVKDAQQTTLSGYDDAIRRKVFADWSAWNNPFKGDFDSFYASTYNWTNGFDPKNGNTARIIGGPDFQNYQKTYQAALEMQSLGKDLTRAISYYPLGGIGGAVEQKLDPEGHGAHERLVRTLWTAMTGESKPPQGKDRSNIESRLLDLKRENLDDNGAKAKLMDMMQNEYGLNFDLLHQYGLLS